MQANAEKSENKSGRSVKITVWVKLTLGLIIAAMLLTAGTVAVVDPYFRYHAPIITQHPPLFNERYQNRGILERFDYDSIITGTCLSENFKTSQAQELFGGSFVKVANSAGTYRKIGELIECAYDTGHDVKLVIRSIDFTNISEDASDYDMRLDPEFPYWLYDKNPLNDVNYLLDIDAFMYSVETLSGIGTRARSFDDYGVWESYYTYGREQVLKKYDYTAQAQEQIPLTPEERAAVLENVRLYVTDIAGEHPETVFICFIPPYSIAYWDDLRISGGLDARLEAERIAIEEMVSCDNIRIISFAMKEELITSLDDYKDLTHYAPWINEGLMEELYSCTEPITGYNYEQYLAAEREMFENYDYEALHGLWRK